MTARSPFTARIGLALILIGIAWFCGWACWEATRIWVSLNVPISLSQGHIRTPEFKINVESSYEIEIEVTRGFDFWGVPCLVGGDQCEGDTGVLQVSWSLASGGRVVANGSSNGNNTNVDRKGTLGRIVGRFDAEPGTYVLDLDVLQDGSRLNSGTPRLIVVEAIYAHGLPNDAGRDSFSQSLLLTAAGTFLIIRSARAGRRERLAVLARGCSLTQPGPQPRNLRRDQEPSTSPTVQPGFRPTAPASVGAILVLAGLAAYASIHNWIATRSFVAVDVPVSLMAGHLKTGPFRINLSDYYTISVEHDDNRAHKASCVTACGLKTRWLLYRDGHVADGSVVFVFPDGFWGGFEGERGVYDLDLEVLEDAGCLNSGHPRLKVFTAARSYAGFTALFYWLCLISMGAGGILLAIGGVERFRKPAPPVAPGVRQGTVAGHLRWRRRPLQARPFSGMSHFGLIATITFLFVSIPLWALQSWPSTGLRIHLMRPGINAQRNPGIQPLLVRAESGGGNLRPILYVDSRRVSWEDFGVVLQKELNQRPPNWPVYFVGNPDMEWQWAVKAIDTIRGLQTRVVLLTAAPASPRGQFGSRVAPNPFYTLQHGRR